MAENWQLKAVLSANATGMIKALKGVNVAARHARKYLLDIGGAGRNLAGQLGMPLGMIAGLTAAFSVAGLKSAVTNFAALGDEVVKSAKRIGVSTDEYQRLKYIAEQSGVSADELGSSVGRLNKNIALAAAGKNKDFASLMAHAGIALRDANGELRSGADLLPEVADLMARNKNAAVQARLGNTIFGKSWATLAPLLQEGSGGIEALTERYKLLGITVGEDALLAGEKLGDQMDDLRLVTASYGNAITQHLLPVLSPMIEDMIKWAVANREMITIEVSKFVKDLATSLREVDWKGVIQGARDFVEDVKGIIKFVGGAKNALIGLVIIMNMQTIAAFFSLASAIVRASWAFGAFALKAIPQALIALGLYTPATTAAAVATDALTVSTNAASVAAGGWLTKLSAIATTFGTIAAAAAPLAVMYGVTEWAGDPNDMDTNLKSASRADWMGENMAAPTNDFLSMFGFDKNADIEARRAQNRAELTGETPLVAAPQAPSLRQRMFGDVPGQSSPGFAGADRPPLMLPQQVKASGQIEVSFKDVPVGTRIDQKSTGDVPIKSTVGYRSYALGNN